MKPLSVEYDHPKDNSDHNACAHVVCGDPLGVNNTQRAQITNSIISSKDREDLSLNHSYNYIQYVHHNIVYIW